MQIETKLDPVLGRLLWLTDGQTEAAASLDYGIRIAVLRRKGMENLLYRQPEDLSDGLTTEKGWRIFGGHRFWASPESEMSYYPDREPVTFVQEGDSVLFRQRLDPWTGFEKSLRLSFTEDGRIRAEHILTNRNDRPVTAAAWGITTLRGGGNAVVPYGGSSSGEYTPGRVISLWDGTSLGDRRLQFTPSAILATHLPTESSLKIGTYADCGSISMTNLGQRLEISFRVHPLTDQPDNGCNLELFMDAHVMELETLGALTDMAPGESARHTEYWKVEKL